MFSTGFTAFLFSVDFDEYKLGRGILSMKCTVGGFVEKNMVFGDYMSEYSSNGDEK